MSGMLINTGTDSGVIPYRIGSLLDLVFQTDDASALVIGPTLNVQILDIFDNLIDTVVASQADDGQPVYITEYTIPFSITTSYNVGNVDTSSFRQDLYYLKDKWILPAGATLEFPFQVSKVQAQVVTDNAEYIVEMTGIEAADGYIMDSASVHFTSHITPFLCTVQSVVDTFRSAMDTWDPFIIAREIFQWSKHVKYHIEPDLITRQDSYDAAAYQYITHIVAKEILQGTLVTGTEEKALDTFKVSRTVNPEAFLKELEDHAAEFIKILYAGGRDTPFVTARFQKGLYDPNRPNVGRSQLDTSGWYPYVNMTSNSTLVEVDGSMVEVRGERSIGFGSIYNPYYAWDKGDAGYLARI